MFFSLSAFTRSMSWSKWGATPALRPNWSSGEGPEPTFWKVEALGGFASGSRCECSECSNNLISCSIRWSKWFLMRISCSNSKGLKASNWKGSKSTSPRDSVKNIRGFVDMAPTKTRRFKVPGLEKPTYLDLSAILISRFWTRPPKNSWLTVLRHGSHGTHPWTPPAYSFFFECGVKLPKDLGILGSLTLAKGIARPGHRGMAGARKSCESFLGAQKALMGIIWNDIMKASPNWIMLDHGHHALSPSAT